MGNKISSLRGCCLFASVRDGVSRLSFILRPQLWLSCGSTANLSVSCGQISQQPGRGRRSPGTPRHICKQTVKKCSEALSTCKSAVARTQTQPGFSHLTEAYRIHLKGLCDKNNPSDQRQRHLFTAQKYTGPRWWGHFLHSELVCTLVPLSFCTLAPSPTGTTCKWKILIFNSQAASKLMICIVAFLGKNRSSIVFFLFCVWLVYLVELCEFNFNQLTILRKLFCVFNSQLALQCNGYDSWLRISRLWV